MADVKNTNPNVIISVKADTSAAGQSIGEVKNQLDNLGKIELDKSVRTLKQELKLANNEAQRIANSIGTNNDQFRESAKRVAELKDQVQEYSATIQSFNPDNKLQALVGVAKGAVGAIQGVTGAMAFLGIESDTASKTVAKLQGLMAFSQALNSVADIKDSFKNLGSVLGLTTKATATATVATETLGIATEGAATATETATVATEGLGVAFKAIGIGLIVAAIALLIANFDKVKQVVLNLVPGLGSVASFIGNIVNKITDFVGITSEAGRQTAKTIEQLNSAIKNGERDLDLNGDKYDKYTQQKIKADLSYKKSKQEFLKDDKLSEDEKNRYISEAYQKRLREINSADAGRQDEIDKNNEAAQKKQQEAEAKAAAKRKEEAAKRTAILEAEAKAQDEVEKLHAENRASINKDEGDKEKARIEAEFQQSMTALKLNAKISDSTRLQLEAEYEQKKNLALHDLKDKQAAVEEKAEQDRQDRLNKLLEERGKTAGLKVTNGSSEDEIKERAELTRKYTMSETELKLADLQTEYEREYALLAGNQEAQLALTKKHKAEVGEVEDKDFEKKKQRFEAVGQLTTDLASILGKNTVAAKALNAANAVMNTWTGVSEIWRAKSVLPEPFGTAAKVASTGVAIFSGFNAVKNILATKVPGGGGDASGGINASVSAAQAAIAPSISASAATDNGPKDVRVINQSDMVIKSYISDRDLQDHQDRKDFLNKLGTV